MSINSGAGRQARRAARTVAAAVAVVTATGVLAGCASSSDSKDGNGGKGGGSASSTVLPKSGCGSLPTAAPNDPDGLVAKLPAALAANYNLYPGKIEASSWAKWKPTHPAPYKVAVIWNPPINTFVSNSLKSLTSTLKASGQVDIVSSTAPRDPTDVPGNIQLYNQAVAAKPDLIISFPLAAQPLIPAIAAAAKQGIPTVSAWVTTDSPDAVSVAQNQVLTAATLAAHTVSNIGGEGNALLVHGIPSVSQDIQAQAGYKAVLKRCPKIKVVGEVTGNYAAAPAKSATLQFLTGHPAPVSAVMQSGTMTVGVIQAFQQLGRKVPAIADDGSTQGSIAYAHQNKASYQAYGASTNDAAIGAQSAKVALKMLSGTGGPVVNQLLVGPTLITPANLDQVYKSGWTMASQGNAAVPTDKFLSDADITTFFGGK